jgi:2-oxoglutarate ferredoxin oxidoreductase subunit alpha
VQECADLTCLAFDLADQYRMPVILLADGMIGQMMEGVVLPPERPLADLPKRDWTAGNMIRRREARGAAAPAVHITSIHLVPEELEEKTKARFERYEQIRAAETRFEDAGSAGADLTLVAYGTSARVCQGAKKLAEKEGMKLGLFRPITLWPFPYGALAKIAGRGKPLLTVEMSLGQLVEDVKLSVLESSAKSTAVHLLGHSGGVIPTEEEVFAEAKRILSGAKK